MKTKLTIFKKPTQLLKIYLARYYAKLYSKDLFVGVGGSVGQTTCVQSCEAVLSQKFKTLATQPNLDPALNIPLTLLKLTPKFKKVILEMGIDYKGEMDFYLSLVQPKTVIMTQISYVNCEDLGDIDEIVEEESKLIKQLDTSGVAILNFDDPQSKKLAKECQGSVIYYGSDPQNCTVLAGNIKI